MGLIAEYRTSLENPSTPLSYPAEWLLDIFNGGRTDSGIRVSEMTALQVTCVYCCVEIKAGAIGALELKIYEKIVNKDGRMSRHIAHDHDLWDLLEHEPNCEMTSFTLRKTVQAHRMLWGNGYIEIQRDGGNKPVALWPRNPARCKLRRAMKKLAVNGELVQPGDMVYATTEGMETESMDPENPTPNPTESERIILPADMIHIPGLALDGRMGQDVIQLARNAVGLTLATEKFGGKFFGNGAVGFGVFEYPAMMTPEAREVFKRSIQEAWGGENVQRPMLAEGGVKYTPTATKPNEGQFLETRNFQLAEICRIFNVPPHMVGVTEKQNRANTEQIGQEFVTFSLRPDLTAWQQEFKRKLFPAATVGRNAGRKFNVFFDTWPLVVPSATDLRQLVQSMIQWGVWAPNDALEKLNMNPREDEASDSTWMQINMAPTDELYESPALPGVNDSQDDQNEGKDSARSAAALRRLVRPFQRIFRDRFGAICARDRADTADFRRAFMPIFISIGEQLEQIAAAEMHADPSPDALESSKFLVHYLDGMRSRLAQWKTANGNADQVAQRELERAGRAILIEVYRMTATRVAKQESQLPEEAEV